jgi:L-ornithine N5-oxygenase
VTAVCAGGGSPGPAGTRADVYDVLGVGFGPANMALAIALDEHNAAAAARGGRPVRALFLEQRPEPRWHPGLLLPDASMQISFLKDLATFRNPRSRYTFVNYLQTVGRLVDFTNRGRMAPLRVEFSAYLQWVARQLDGYLLCGSRVSAVEPCFVSGPGGEQEVDLFTVTIQRDGRTEQLLARSVVVAAGLQPRLPAGVEPGPRVWHSAGYLDRVEGIRDPADLVVVGSGQSALEVALDLYDRFRRARVHLVSSRFGISPSDQGPLVNRIFDPESVDTLFAAAPQVRDRVDRLHRNTNNASAHPREIQAFFDAQYRDRWLGEERLVLHRMSRLTSVLETAGEVRVGIASDLDGGNTEVRADALVLGTGYDTFDTSRLLGAHSRLIRRDAAGRVQLDRSYRARLEVAGRAGLYLVGQSDHQHGIGDTLLSTVAVRAGQIADSILASLPAPCPDLARGPRNHVQEEPMTDDENRPRATSADVPLERVRRLVAAVVPDDLLDAGPEEDLRDYGLDSIRLMDVLTELRGAGVPVALEDLAGEPTLAALAGAVARAGT